MLVYKTNMTSEPLGELEHLVLLSIIRLGPESCGVPIVDELRKPVDAPVLIEELRRHLAA